MAQLLVLGMQLAKLRLQRLEALRLGVQKGRRPERLLEGLQGHPGLVEVADQWPNLLDLELEEKQRHPLPQLPSPHALALLYRQG